jgi:hypothetical protein
MSFQEKVFFVTDVLLPGGGWRSANSVFIREEDGRYRVASGADLAWVHERAPKFVRKTLDEGYCEECGASLISSS